MHYYITCLSKSGQLELSHYLTLSPYLTLSHYYLTLSPYLTLSLPHTLSLYLTLSHYPGLSQPRPPTVSLPKCLRMRTSNFLPQTRGRPISQWQKLVSLLAVSLPRLPRARSQEHSRLAPRSHHSQTPLSELALSLTPGEHR